MFNDTLINNSIFDIFLSQSTAGFEYAFELLHRVFHFFFHLPVNHSFYLSIFPSIKIVQQYNQSGLGSQCNQAIMLITDGLSETHNDVCGIIVLNYTDIYLHI